MGESSERPAELVRLVLDFGESVEVDGSTVFDPVAEESVPAVDGTTTQVAQPPSGDGAGYLGFTTRDVGYAIVGFALWRTDDGAETWRRLDIATP